MLNYDGKSVYMPHRTLRPMLPSYLHLHHWIVFARLLGDPTIHPTGGAALRVLILSRLILPSVPYHPTTLSLTTEEAVSLSLLVSILRFSVEDLHNLLAPGC
jgi:hypothetical protein